MRFALAAVAAALMLPAAGAAQAPDTLRLSIEEAVATAVRTADETRIAEAQVSIADAQVVVARAAALPQLRITSGYTRTIESARGQAVGQFFAQANTYTANANFSQTIFQGGREFAATRAASRLRAAARLDAEEVRARIALDVQRAYLEALFADRLVEIQSTNYALASERLAQAEQFQRAGRAARYDVLRARVERTNLEPTLITARADREIALLQLKQLLNLPLDRAVTLTTVVDTVAVQTLLTAVSAGDDSLGQGEGRAAVRAAELAADARRLGLRAARGERWPSISVFANLGYQAFPPNGFPTSFGRLDPVVIPCPAGSDPSEVCTRNQQNGGWFSDRNVGVQLAWPIFDGLRTEGNIDLAAAQARLARLQLQQEREAVALEVANARAQLARARAFFEAQRQNAGEADETFRLASLRYGRGLGTQLEVSDAQLALLTARTNSARAVYDLYLATAELARALGRPVPLPPGSGAPARTTSTTSTDDSAQKPR
ncbi:MAG TPA: TolC family protein [Gemmatimonadaceae bacterium]|nr:TolC family protein [Gemmatimonadaceae bacterium]